ncbi:MAG TPA: MoxR family ATPase [Bacillota bacterium]|jgi:MoxR-like ATPase|nr:MoxR family ATPase [Bacillota bacterium]HQE65916.1 MoxR family ATPase [Bacillota bacterium]HQI15910.1 MoxR family ATPase [Bacillota bacterium]HQJ37080.1 MoxR family ATPase [Bacillota bacterium]HQL36673.1 MoxR family ATPase [Bacillota bacterium]
MEINEKQIREIIDTVNKVEAEIGKTIIGQKDIVKQVLIAILAGGNVLLEGVPGLGKTQLVKTLSKVMDLSFSRIQFTPDLMPADVMGTNIIVKDDSGNSRFEFQKGPVFANLVLADEINRATPKTQSALLEAMQEQTVTVGKVTYSLPQPFLVLATQNPIEMEGTYPLPEAQMDRFLFKLSVLFPSFDELKEIMDITTTNKEVELQKVIDGESILLMRRIIREVPIAKPVQEYALRVVLGTHPEIEGAPGGAKKYIRFGASPRAAQAIITASRARALMEGRYNVSFEDIKYVAHPSLRHRFFLNFDAVADGITTDVLIDRLLDEVTTYL